jgi:hypothetical protein
LVAELFVPNPDPENKIYVNHKNSNRLDPDYKNLEWVTASENTKHIIDNNNNFGYKRAISKYDLNGNFICTYESAQKASLEHNIHRSCIVAVLTGKTKTSAGFIWKYNDETKQDEPKDNNPKKDELNQEMNIKQS